MWNPNEIMAKGERTVSNQFRGGWSPSARMLMAGLGTGLFIYGLTKSAPTACILGTLGALMVAEGVSNADLSNVAQKAMDMGMTVGTGGMAGIAGRAASAVANAAGSLGTGSGSHKVAAAAH